jgi:hypothetical protein
MEITISYVAGLITMVLVRALFQYLLQHHPERKQMVAYDGSHYADKTSSLMGRERFNI